MSTRQGESAPLFTLQYGIAGRYERIKFPDPKDVPFYADCVVFAAKNLPFTFAILDEHDKIVKQGSGNLEAHP